MKYMKKFIHVKKFALVTSPILFGSCYSFHQLRYNYHIKTKYVIIET